MLIIRITIRITKIYFIINKTKIINLIKKYIKFKIKIKILKINQIKLIKIKRTTFKN